MDEGKASSAIAAVQGEDDSWDISRFSKEEVLSAWSSLVIAGHGVSCETMRLERDRIHQLIMDPKTDPSVVARLYTSITTNTQVIEAMKLMQASGPDFDEEDDLELDDDDILFGDDFD